MKHVFVNPHPHRPHSMRAILNTDTQKLKGTTMKESTTEVKDLVTLNEKNEAVTTSLKVATKFGKWHDHVLRDIKSLILQDKELAPNFGVKSQPVKTGQGGTRQVPYYEMTRDGFTLLAFGFTRATALQFKKEYIAAFNKMEQALRNRQPEEVPLVSLENIQKLHGALGFTLKELERKEAVITQLETKTQEMKPKARRNFLTPFPMLVGMSA